MDFRDDKSPGDLLQGVFALVQFVQNAVFVLGLPEQVAVLGLLGLHFDYQKSCQDVNAFEHKVLNVVVLDHFFVAEHFIQGL